MRVKVSLFGHIGRKIGREIDVELHENSTLANAVRLISERYGMGTVDLMTEEASQGAFVVTLNGNMEKPTTSLKSGDVIAFYPPVTGG